MASVLDSSPKLKEKKKRGKKIVFTLNIEKYLLLSSIFSLPRQLQEILPR